MASRVFESRSSIAPPLQKARASATAPRANAIPWYLWCAALAVTSSSVGARWDVSWHESIGRDTFWTPAHMAIYLCGVLAAIVCGYLILNTTFRKPPGMVARSVHVMGFTGPLGAFLAAWGGIAMLTSAPFDNWWHSAYGLDVRIISPPHTLLILGSMAVSAGSLLLILAEMNRAVAGDQSFLRLRRLLLYLFALILSAAMFFCTEYTRDILLHSAVPYIAMSLCVPLCFAMAWKASRFRWAATSIAAIFTAMSIGFILILPLFPAQPRLGPVYQPVTHFVPPQFPMLLTVPAIVVDLLWRWIGDRNKALVALVSAPVFVLSLLGTEWPFASFLMTKAAENRFFATGYHPYAMPSWSPSVTRHFMRVMHGARMERGLALAMICAAIGVLLGLMMGDLMRKIQR